MYHCEKKESKFNWNKFIDKYNNPWMVLKIQNYFGVHWKIDSANGNSDLSASDFISSSENNELPIICNRNDKDNKVNGQIDGFSSSFCETNGTHIINRRIYSNKDDVSVDGVKSGSETESSQYIVKNKFWFCLFSFGTMLGDEIFYATFIPFWFWNIDHYIGRRFVLIWAIIMYIGQGLKDIIQWPRPASPPVVRLQKKWALEYGMPSTHSMVGIAIPFSILLYSIDRYQYPVIVGVIIATVWCVVICISRLYLGMHTVLDIFAGLILAVLLMFPFIPIIDNLDNLILTGRWSPFIVTFTSILLLTFAPKGDRWTPTRGDTAVVTAVTVGIQVGAWLNNELGYSIESSLQAPYKINWPTYQMLGLILIRTVFGLVVMMTIREIFKRGSLITACYLLKLNENDIKNKNGNNRRQTIVELSNKFITYFSVGIAISHLCPILFNMIYTVYQHFIIKFNNKFY